MLPSTIFKILGDPVPEVSLRVIDTTLSAVGATVLADDVAGTLTKKSLFVISPDRIVANAGAPLVVALKY